MPLHVAASKGDTEIVRELLKRGADIDAQSDTLETGNLQLTALEAAIWYNHPAICKLLLESGANPDIQSTREGTALHYAFEYKQLEMADWLLDYGADPFLERKNAYNKSPPLDFDIANADGKLVARMLGQDRANPLGKSIRSRSLKPKSRAELERAVKKLINDRGGVLVGAAARRGQLEAVQALIKAGASASGLNDQGILTFHGFAISEAAAAKSHEFDSNRWSRIQELLLAHGADYDIFAATALDDLPRARTVLNADKNAAQARDKDGQTPLHWAVQTDRPDMSSFWIKFGASLAATNAAGQTALHIASAKGLVEQVKLLLAAHAPTSIHDTNGWTPLDAAVHAKQRQTIRLLLEAGAPDKETARGISTNLHEAAATGNLAVLSALTENRTNLEARNELGLTPFQLAVTSGHLAAAALLVDKGANVNVQDANGNNILQMILLDKAPWMPDVPSSNWMARMAPNTVKQSYAKYVPIDPEHTGGVDMLRVTGFLLLCGMDVKNTNHAGKSAIDLAANKDVNFHVPFFDDQRERFLKMLRDAAGVLASGEANGDTPLHH